MKNLLMLVVMFACMFAGRMYGATPIETVESKVEGSTYLDFTDTTMTRNDLSAITTATDWGYPDTSDGAYLVNGSGYDEKDNGGSDFIATITGARLATVYAVVMGNTASQYDFGWGSAADGSPVNIVFPVATAAGAIDIDDTGGHGLYAVPLGEFDGSGGSIVLHFGTGNAFNGVNAYRTIFDGVLVVPALVVDAGESIITTATLAASGFAARGSVEYRGGSHFTVGWEAYEAGSLTTKVSFDDPTDPNTLVTVSEAGTYILKLTATVDTVSHLEEKGVIVFDDACDAAKATGKWTPNIYDRNDDCEVDTVDLSIFAAEWLDSTALSETSYTAYSNPPPIIPNPISAAMGYGYTILSENNVIYYSDGSLLDVAELLQEDLHLLHGLDLPVQLGSTAGTGDILLTLNPSFPDTEKYQLTVNGSITLEARSMEGIYPGTVSILQALSDYSGQFKKIPNMTIIDEPYRQVRGVMASILAHWHSVDNIKEIIRMCRFYKIKHLYLHVNSKQWIAAVMNQTEGIAIEQRKMHILYTKSEIDEIIVFARKNGVGMLPCNATVREWQSMHDAVSYDFNPSDNYANFIDEYDGQGVYTGDYNDDRYWNFIDEVTRRAIDQYSAGYSSGTIPYYHIGAVQGEGGMSRDDAVKLIGYIRAKDPNIKTQFWDGIDGTVNDDLSALKPYIVIAYYLQWGGSDIVEYLNNGWNVFNAAWSPLYIVEEGPDRMVHRTQEQVYEDWNLYRVGTAGNQSGQFVYDDIIWTHFDNPATNNQVLGGIICTWGLVPAVHLDLLRPRVPAFVEHAWHHKTWPYPGTDFPDFITRYTSANAYLTNFLK